MLIHVELALHVLGLFFMDISNQLWVVDVEGKNFVCPEHVHIFLVSISYTCSIQLLLILY